MDMKSRRDTLRMHQRRIHHDLVQRRPPRRGHRDVGVPSLVPLPSNHGCHSEGQQCVPLPVRERTGGNPCARLHSESSHSASSTPTQVGDGQMNSEPLTEGKPSVPVLQNAPAYVECRVRRIVDDVGDHAVVILEVLEGECRQQTCPMTIAQSPWHYGG
jgi:hypothetical protein